MGTLNKINTKKLTWIDINHPNRSDLAFLKTKFKFSEEDIEAALPTTVAQRPRATVRSNYLFLAVLFPVYNSITTSIESAEVDVFLTDDHIITTHDKKIKHLGDYFNKFKNDKRSLLQHSDDSPSYFFYELLATLYHEIFPMLDHIHQEIKSLEKRLLMEESQIPIHEILKIKGNILSFKLIMQAHRSMVKKLLETETAHFGNSKYAYVYFNELLAHVKDIWGILETYSESIESIENTNNAIIDQGTNKVMKTLTVMTVLVYPFTILASLFGMNTDNPIGDNPYGFWILISSMIALVALTYYIFKKKNWI